MKLNYYPETDSLYIDLSEKTSVDSREISDGVVLDYDADGNLVGIDIDNARKKVQPQELRLSGLPVDVEMVAHFLSPSDGRMWSRRRAHRRRPGDVPPESLPYFFSSSFSRYLSAISQELLLQPAQQRKTVRSLDDNFHRFAHRPERFVHHRAGLLFLDQLLVGRLGHRYRIAMAGRPPPRR